MGEGWVVALEEGLVLQGAPQGVPRSGSFLAPRCQPVRLQCRFCEFCEGLVRPEEKLVLPAAEQGLCRLRCHECRAGRIPRLRRWGAAWQSGSSDRPSPSWHQALTTTASRRARVLEVAE